MISRRTALVIADTYVSFFEKPNYRYSSPGRDLDFDGFYDLLYAKDYPSWLLSKLKHDIEFSSSREHCRVAKEVLLNLHTGTTQYYVTKKLSSEERKQLGQIFLVKLAEDALNSWREITKAISTAKEPPQIKTLLSNLELDGYKYNNSRLLGSEVDALDVREELGLLESLYLSLGLDNKVVVLQHLTLSEEHYLAKRWSDCVANSRNFLEGVLREVASAHSLRCNNVKLPDTTYKRPVEVRDYLEKAGILDAKEKEALAKVYGLLSEKGSHPYIADSDQARLLRHLSLTFSQYVMLSFDAALKSIQLATETS